MTIGVLWPRGQIYTRAYDQVLGTSMELRLLASSAQAADRDAVADHVMAPFYWLLSP